MWKISIITVNLNNGNAIRKTLQSVIAQTHTDIEHIVIDGGSDDDSIAIIKEFEKHIAYWISERDNGIYHGMNKGIKRATGKYLLFLNSGDYLANNYVIEKAVKKFIKLENARGELIFYGNIVVEGKIDPAPKKINLDILSSASLPHPASFISKTIFDQIGHYNENYKIISDWIFFLNAYLAQVQFEYIDYPITTFELNGISSNFKKAEEEKRQYLLSNYPNFIEDFKLFASFKKYKLSRLHKWVERLSSTLRLFK